MVPGKDPRSRTIERQAAGIRRMVRALTRRCREGDPEPLTNPELALAEVWACREEIDTCAKAMVVALRRLGYSWADIAALTGMRRQSAYERWADICRAAGVDD
jgi:hypothetical protein